MEFLIMGKRFCNYKYGFYKFKFDDLFFIIGLRIPFTKIDIRCIVKRRPRTRQKGRNQEAGSGKPL